MARTFNLDTCHPVRDTTVTVNRVGRFAPQCYLPPGIFSGSRLEKLRRSETMIRVPPDISFELASIPLLHGTGGSAYDELLIYGGIGGIVVALGLLSWRASRKKDVRRRKRRLKKG